MPMFSLDRDHQFIQLCTSPRVIGWQWRFCFTEGGVDPNLIFDENSFDDSNNFTALTRVWGEFIIDHTHFWIEQMLFYRLMDSMYEATSGRFKLTVNATSRDVSCGSCVLVLTV